MTFDFFQQLSARQAGWQGIRGQVQGVELDDVMMRAVANGWARTDVSRSAFAVGATDTLECGFCADTRRDLVRAGLDAVMHPMIDALAFLAIRIVHDDGVAERARRAGVPVQRRRNIVSAATLGIAGGGVLLGGARVDAQYRRRFGPNHFLAFDLRAESIQSDDPRRGYERQSAGVAYTRPVAPDLRVRPALEAIRTEFDGRLTVNGERRRDKLVVPEVEVLWWPGKWRVEAEAKYIFTDSNEPVREREGYRLTLSVGYAF